MKKLFYILPLVAVLLCGFSFRDLQSVSGPVAVSNVSSNSLVTNCIAYWKFNEITNGGPRIDVINGITLIDTNGAVSSAGKINNGATNSVATKQRLHIPAGSASLLCPSNMSISFWIKPSGSTSKRILSLGPYSETQPYRFEIVSGGSTLTWSVTTNNGSSGQSSVTYNGGGSYWPNKWWHIVLIANGSNGTSKVYTNSVLLGTNFFAGVYRYVDTGKPFYLMADDGNTLPLDGIIDELGFWDRELSGLEVTNLYNSGTGLSYPF